MIDFIRCDHFHVCVPPDLLEEARTFYGTVLGLKEIYRPGHLFSSPGHWFDIGDLQLHVGIETPLGETIRHTAMQVADLTVARTWLEQNNVVIAEEPAIPGRMRFAFFDPFGNRMELLQITV